MISLNSILNNVYDAACESLDKTIDEIATVSRENFVPVDKGVLKASQQNELVEHSNKAHYREISFGKSGESSKYAAIVHEDLSKNHPHGSAKYLERPVQLYQSKISENIKSAVEGSLDH